MAELANNPNPAKAQKSSAVIPLEPPQEKDYARASLKLAGNSLKVSLKTNPDHDGSDTVDRWFPVFNKGLPEEWLKWNQNLVTVCKGLSITTGPAKVGMIKQMLAGEALRTFKLAMTGKAETIANADAALKDVTELVFPKKAMTRQKRYLRYEIRKDREWTVRQFSNRMIELNDYLEFFPNGTAASKMAEDEMKECVIKAMPSIWQRKFYDHEDLDESSFQDMVMHLERIEFAENLWKDPTNGAKVTGRHESQKKYPKKVARNDGDLKLPASKKGKGSYCPLHGPNCGHTMGECKTLYSMATQKRQTFLLRTPQQKFHDAEQKVIQKRKERQEVNAMAKTMAKAIQKVREDKAQKPSIKQEESHAIEHAAQQIMIKQESDQYPDMDLDLDLEAFLASDEE